MENKQAKITRNNLRKILCNSFRVWSKIYSSERNVVPPFGEEFYAPKRQIVCQIPLLPTASPGSRYGLQVVPFWDLKNAVSIAVGIPLRRSPKMTLLCSYWMTLRMHRWSVDSIGTEESWRWLDGSNMKASWDERKGVDQGLELVFPLPLEDTLREGPLMRMVIQWCLRRSKSASTRDFLWKRSYHSG